MAATERTFMSEGDGISPSYGTDGESIIEYPVLSTEKTTNFRQKASKSPHFSTKTAKKPIPKSSTLYAKSCMLYADRKFLEFSTQNCTLV
ncbi:MAG: hypothetical protein ACYS6K_10830 [Planctomycetota bacterium]|jgi:hypothetical protein